MNKRCVTGILHHRFIKFSTHYHVIDNQKNNQCTSHRDNKHKMNLKKWKKFVRGNIERASVALGTWGVQYPTPCLFIRISPIHPKSQRIYFDYPKLKTNNKIGLFTKVTA